MILDAKQGFRHEPSYYDVRPRRAGVYLHRRASWGTAGDALVKRVYGHLARYAIGLRWWSIG
jgi:hypothetical protein